MENVKISKQAAAAIEDMRAKGAPLNEIVERHIHADHIRVNGYGIVEQLSTDTLIRALYIGYEVERTREDKVREYYDSLAGIVPEQADEEDKQFVLGERSGIKITLDMLNIRIEGVND